MKIGGSSNALDVSALREDLKYMRASNVNVSNFVSVKLSGRSNYKIWKEQMLCLIKSQALHYIVDAGCPSPGDKGVNPQYDQLVKGWIFGSMNEKVLRDLIDLATAQEVWMKLESLFSSTVSYSEGDSSNTHDIQALNVDASNMVSEKLVGKTNYHTTANDNTIILVAQSIFKIIKNAATEATTANDNTILQVAVETESAGTKVVKHTPGVETRYSRTRVKELYEAFAKGMWRKAKLSHSQISLRGFTARRIRNHDLIANSYIERI